MSSTVVIALGSNLGNREWYLRAAIAELQRVVHVVRISPIRETEPVNAPPPRYLNCIVAGYTDLSPEALMRELLAIEQRLGRRRSFRNAPRTIDLDLILHSANLRRTPFLTLPHPRFREREFVTGPMREMGCDLVLPEAPFQVQRAPLPSAASTYSRSPRHLSS